MKTLKEMEMIQHLTELDSFARTQLTEKLLQLLLMKVFGEIGKARLKMLKVIGEELKSDLKALKEVEMIQA